jgi:hypothetical protein
LKGLPMSFVELAFFTRPVTGESAPGMPMPTLPRAPRSRSAATTSSAIARTMAS